MKKGDFSDTFQNVQISKIIIIEYLIDQSSILSGMQNVFNVEK